MHSVLDETFLFRWDMDFTERHCIWILPVDKTDGEAMTLFYSCGMLLQQSMTIEKGAFTACLKKSNLVTFVNDHVRMAPVNHPRCDAHTVPDDPVSAAYPEEPDDSESGNLYGRTICRTSQYNKEFDLCQLPLFVAVPRNYSQDDLQTLAQVHCRLKASNPSALYYELLDSQGNCRGSIVYHPLLAKDESKSTKVILMAENGNHIIKLNKSVIHSC